MRATKSCLSRAEAAGQVREKAASFCQRFFHQQLAVAIEDVEGDELAGVVRQNFFRQHFSPEAALDVGEGEHAAVAPGDDFAIQEKLAGEL